MTALRGESGQVAAQGHMQKLTTDFFDRPTLDVARDLVGCLLVREDGTGRRLVGEVVETEAYTHDDPAFHAWGIVDGPTGLVKPSGRGYDLFGRPGFAYVYLVYGMYWMLNVLTEREGVAGCVLIRALEPVEGESVMWERRPAARTQVDLTNGPGKLTQAMDIDDRFHRGTLLDPPLYFAQSENPRQHRIETSSRIGITRAVDRQWRFFSEGSRFVSPGVPSDVAASRRRSRRPLRP